MIGYVIKICVLKKFIRDPNLVASLTFKLDTETSMYILPFSPKRYVCNLTKCYISFVVAKFEVKTEYFLNEREFHKSCGCLGFHYLCP